MLPPNQNPHHGGNPQQPSSTSSNIPVRPARHRVPAGANHFHAVNSMPVQESQDLNQPGAQRTMNPMHLQNPDQSTANFYETASTMLQGFCQNSNNELPTSPPPLPVFNRSSGMPVNSFNSDFAQPYVHNSAHGQAGFVQQGSPSGIVHPDYGPWTAHAVGTNPALGLGGPHPFNPAFASPTVGLFPSGWQSMSAEPAMVSKGRPRQPGRHGGSIPPSDRWTKEVNDRLLPLKEQKKSHKEIVKTLKTEFPFLDDLNENILAKRIASLREAAADPIKLDKSINRLMPAAIPLVASEFFKLAEEHGFSENVNRKREDIEIRMRAWYKAMVQSLILDMKREMRA